MTSPLFLSLQQISPDGAVLLLTGGCGLIALELNRPGLVLPGSTGLLLVLLAAFVLHSYAVFFPALLALLLACAVLLLNVWIKVPVAVLVFVTVVLGASLQFLARPTATSRVHAWVAWPCGLLLGAAGGFLSRVALRARRAKRVN